ncbi:MAG TPA: sulfur carrier protein ThiS [Candidatus Solibacter sp.]|jgi:sulfur carrier protein|nr:sulfur carrier protein ThiS [Candidatus Solibacter sp.]
MTTPATATMTVNGDPMTLGELRTVGELLGRLKIVPERVVVELNGVIYRRGEGLDQPLGAGDVVEIVQFVGGG